MIIRIINKFKEHMNKYMNELKNTTPSAKWNNLHNVGYKRGIQ
jgi:hypothetical protein